jgi:L-Ala-D/L-Glu epimerase
MTVAIENLRLAAPFRISGFVCEEQDVILITLEDGAHRGRSEGAAQS